MAGIFDIIGPVMVGPSSSHTAGAVRIGLVSRKLLAGASGRELEIEAASIGGGRIVVNKIDGIDVNFSGENNTLVVHNQDRPGQVARVTGMITDQDVNISTMQLYRKSRGIGRI